MVYEASSQEFTTMPSELTRPLPRRIDLSLTEGDGRYLLLIVLVFFIGGISFLGWESYDDVRQFRQRNILRGDSREVVGQVTGYSYGRFSPKSINYRFTADGNTYSGKALEPASPAPRTSFDIGDIVLIRYLPSNPAVNHPSAWEWSPMTGWYFVAGEVFLTSMGFLALVFLLRDWRLARYGHVAAGSVTNCKRDDRWFRVEYEFRTRDGRLVRGHSDLKDEYGAGARIWILYLPENPQRNQSYPLSFFSVVG